MSLTVLKCEGCGNSFEKRTSEINRQRKLNPDYKFYCNRSCFATHSGKFHLGKDLGVGQPDKLLSYNRKDEYSPFRYYMNRARNRKMSKKVRDTNLTLEYLKELWESQGGRCALSGRVMDLPATTKDYEAQSGNPWKASLDRIDNDKGYLKGNVRFVTAFANIALQSWPDQIAIAFCRDVANYHGLEEPHHEATEV